ncbi:MAG: metallopeptidase family protein [Elusimicrobiales bacterium]
MSEFEALAAAAVASLPEFFRAKLDNVVVVAEYAPPPRLGGRRNFSLLGLYEGVPADRRGSWYSGQMPDKITLFKRNIEKSCSGPGEIKACVEKTVRHEIAHHFGISDSELLEKGLY